MQRLAVRALSFLYAWLFGTLAFGGLFGIDYNSGVLYSVSTVDASLTPVGSTGVANFAEIEFAPDGTLYGFTSGPPGICSLYTINPSTAEASLVGPLGVEFVSEGGLAFTPNGIAYGGIGHGSGGIPGQAQLFSLNLATGAATAVANLGFLDINGLTYRSDGSLIGLDRVDNALVVINPTTGSDFGLVNVPSAVGAVGGMTVLNGVGYYNTSGPGGSSIPGSNNLYSFNLFTGASKLVGSLGPTITGTGISGLAAQVPEPSSLILASFGVVGLAVWGWRRRSLAR